jgi:hypothetical protein
VSDRAADPLQAIADGLRQRVGELAQAEEQLARFAFSEATGAPERGAGEPPPPWRHFTGRALAAAGDPVAMGLLQRLEVEGAATVAVLGEWLEADRLAVIDRLNHLMHVGCVSRDLETDRVAVSALGQALVALVDEISRRAGSVAAAP